MQEGAQLYTMDYLRDEVADAPPP
ncbi:hypothetical protein SAMN04487952_101125 [Halomonas caseinilytica]|nr:hypothetical protein SAMN04487952_101125 [Halomonas caseinilytica]